MKRYLFTLVILLYFHSLSGQSVLWEKTIGGDTLDRLHSVHPTLDGGVIVGGESYSSASGDKSANSWGKQDYWVVKLDSSGNIQWENTIGGDQSDYLSIVRVTSDSGYVVYGYSDSDITGDKTEISMNNDIWILKLDALGNIIWQNTINESNGPTALAMDTTSDGGFICGATGFGTSNNEKTCNSLGLSDYWVLKLDFNGNIEWQACYGGSGADLPRSVHEAPDGGYIIGGLSTSDSSGVKSENSLGGSDYWVIKTDSIGNIEWENTIGGSDNDYLFDVIPSKDGGFICCGYSSSPVSGDKTEPTTGGADCWVVKLDANGNIVWQNTIGGSSQDFLRSATITNNNDILLASYSSSSVSGDKTEASVGNVDYWVVALDSLGHYKWQNTIGGSNNDYLRNVFIGHDGNIICGGYSNSNNSGDKSQNSKGSYDYWVMKLDYQSNIANGELYGDLNQNAVNDAFEPRVPYKKIDTNVPGLFSYSNYDGFYSMLVGDTGTYVLTSEAVNYFNLIPGSRSVVFNNYLLVDSLNDFGYQPNGLFNDLRVVLSPYSKIRPGFKGYYSIFYQNNGTSILSPSIWYYPDSNLTFNASIPTPSSNLGDSILFNLGTLQPFESGRVRIEFQLPASVPIGTDIFSSAKVEPIVNDVTPANNTSDLHRTVVGAYDPNTISVNRTSLYTFELTSPEILEYLIEFQNTGTDTAINVVVETSLSQKLQVDKLDFIDLSHPCVIEYQPYENTMRFKFPNILLPDSNTNEMESHGFIRYRVSPQTNLTPGTIIPAQASIFFDYNAPIYTNTANTVILAPTAISEYDESEFKLNIFPNPTSSILNITLESHDNARVEVGLFDAFGRLITGIHSGVIPEQWQYGLDVEELPSGLYFVKISGELNATTRFIKE